MATVILKGTNKTLETTIAKAREINKLKRDGQDQDTPIEINGIVLELKDIRYAMCDEDKDKEVAKEQQGIDSENYYKQTEKDFKDEVTKYANGTLNQKLDFNLRVASFYCYTFTGLWLKDWSKENDPNPLYNKIKEELETEKLIASPKIYKSIFKVVDIITGTDNLANPIYMARQAPLKMMERYLSEVHKYIR